MRWRAIAAREGTAEGAGTHRRAGFFLAHAQSRQDKPREATLRQQIVTDGHAPSQYRAYAVRNLDGWYDAFSVKPSEKLYLAPDARVRVW